jgi:hypothetical protein
VGLGPGDEEVRFGSAECLDRLSGGDFEAFHQYVTPEPPGIPGRPVPPLSPVGPWNERHSQEGCTA